ncbi:MAG: hypothetical protein GC204_11785 [Chloroflexi bacterium]|nr:hypothetical protein [Chloroflexota bacterium]
MLVDLGIYLVNHHSAALLALAEIALVLTLTGIVASWAVTFRLTPTGLTALRRRLARWRGLYLVVTLLILWSFGVGMRPEWVYAHMGLTLASAAVLIYDLLYADAFPLKRTGVIAAAVAAVVVTLLRIGSLSIYPIPNLNDEPWVLGWALSYVRHGTLSDTILFYGGQDVQRFILLVAWWMRIFGPGFWQTRLCFFLMIFPLIGLTALAARNLYGSGWIAALVMFSSAVVMGGARIRDDIGLAVAVAACLWLYSVALKRSQARFHFLAGLAIGLGWFAHYHAIGYGAALAIALYLPDTVERWRQGKRLPERSFWLFVLGGLLGAALVFTLQILPDWAGFLAGRQFRNPHSLIQLAQVFFQHWGNIILASQFEFLLILIAVAAALMRHRRTDVKLVLVLLLMHLALALQAGEAYPQYVLQISPVYGLLLTGLFAHGLRADKIAYGGTAAALFMFINLGMTLQVPVQHFVQGQPLQLPTPPVAAWIRAHVSPTERVVTEHWYYLWLTDYNFVSPLSPFYAPLSKRLATKAAMWDQISPDVVVIDRNLSTCCVQEPIYDLDYLQSRGYQQAAEIPGDKYPILVYEKAAQ